MNSEFTGILLCDKLNCIENKISQLSKLLTDHLATCQGRDTQCHDTQGHDSSTQTCSVHMQIPTVDKTDELAKGEVPATLKIRREHDHSVLLRKGNQKKVKAKGSVASIENTDKSTNRTERESFTIQGEADTKNHRSFKESKHECLRKAIQQNIILLVDNLPCSENDILDMLIENECLTETESSDLRDNGNRKDRVRNLVRIIKGRSYHVLKLFVKCIKEIHPEVAASIWQVYEKLAKYKKNYVRQCAFCVLKRSVDIKVLADYTWSTGAISDQLYADVVDGRSYTEALWQQIADQYNTATCKIRQDTLREFSEALMKKGQYRDLVLKLKKVSALKCTCVKFEADRKSFPIGNLLSPPNIVVGDADDQLSVSPGSSPASSRSLADVNENSMASDDDSPINEHDNYFLSSRTFDNDKFLHYIVFGTKKGTNDVELRKPRSNSIGRDINHLRCLDPVQRRRSMFL